jgi:hypothetical protein
MRGALTVSLAMVVAAALAAVSHVQVSSTATDSRSRLSLEVALAEKGRCTKFVDATVGIVAVANASPGDQSAVTRLCLRASGRARVHLGIRDLTDLERACTGQESSVDPTCAVGAPGELAGSLVQLLSVEPKCFKDAPMSGHPFLALAEAPLNLGILEDQRVVCVVLATRYQPTTAQAAQAAQTDRVEWRYVFGVTD